MIALALFGNKMFNSGNHILKFDFSIAFWVFYLTIYYIFLECSTQFFTSVKRYIRADFWDVYIWYDFRNRAMLISFIENLELFV